MTSNLERYLSDLAKSLTASEVRVGFIDGGTYTDGTSVAEVAYKNEYGVPENNQPARPFFRNAVAKHKDEWGDDLARGLKSGLDVRNVLEAVGGKMQGQIQASISELVDPPLAKYTLELRRERGNNSTKPLEDTRTMISSVNYEVIDD